MRQSDMARLVVQAVAWECGVSSVPACWREHNVTHLNGRYMDICEDKEGSGWVDAVEDKYAG